MQQLLDRYIFFYELFLAKARMRPYLGIVIMAVNQFFSLFNALCSNLGWSVKHVTSIWSTFWKLSFFLGNPHAADYGVKFFIGIFKAVIWAINSRSTIFLLKQKEHNLKIKNAQGSLIKKAEFPIDLLG